MTPATANGESSSQPTFTSSLDSDGLPYCRHESQQWRERRHHRGDRNTRSLSFFAPPHLGRDRQETEAKMGEQRTSDVPQLRLLLNQLFDQRCVSGLRRRADHISATQRRFRPSDDHRKTHNADIN